MAVSVVCGECGWQARVKDDLAGKKIRCRDCGQPVTVSAARTKPETKSPSSLPSRSRSVSPLSDDAATRSAPDERRPPRRSSAKGKPNSKSSPGGFSFSDHWHWIVAGGMVLAAFLPNGRGVAVAGVIAFIGGLMFVYGIIAATIRVIMNDPSQALPMVVSRGARQKVQQRDDDDPFRQMITATFMNRGRTILQGLVLMVAVVPALLLNTGPGPVAPIAARQDVGETQPTTVELQSGEEFGVHVSVSLGDEEHVGVVQTKLDDGRLEVRVVLTGEVVTVPAAQVRNYASTQAEFDAVTAMTEQKMKLATERLKEPQEEPDTASRGAPAKIKWIPGRRAQVQRDGEWRPVRILCPEEDGKIDVAWLDGSNSPDITVDVTDMVYVTKETFDRYRDEIERYEATAWRPGMKALTVRDGSEATVILRSFPRKGKVLVIWADRPPTRPHEVEVASLRKQDAAEATSN